MNKAIATTRTRTATVTASVGEYMAGAAIGGIVGLSTMISLWSFAGLVGVLSTGGFSSLAHGFWMALTGM